MPAKDVVFIPARAFGATQAANQKNRDSPCDYQGNEAAARHEPMKDTMHSSRTLNRCKDLTDTDANSAKFAVTRARAHRNLN
jgi:hypothetical protein